jgi:ribonucleoside-triphosphate reductase
LSLDLAVRTGEYLELQGIAIPKIEEIQDMVEHVLMEEGCAETAKAYILYRAERSRVREKNTRLMRTIDDIVNAESKSGDLKRENANIDGDTAMGSMLRFGSESAKAYYKSYMLKPEHAKAHEAGDIHIHDLDFYSLTMTCCQIDLLKLFEGGFNTGHGHLRKPKDIRSYSALACIAIQSNQNDMHGGQSIPNFDYVMSDGVRCTYKKEYQLALADALELLAGIPTETSEPKIKAMIAKLEKDQLGVPALTPSAEYDSAFLAAIRQVLPELGAANPETDKRILEYTRKHAHIETNRATFQAMEALVHNFNTLHSRAGAQVPFSSINYGMDTSPEAHMVIKNLLIATEQGLGNGETPIFPIQIFRCKKGINFDPEDPNYDLFELACECSAKRLFPNFSFQDAPFNLQYYKEGHPETEIGYMGCRTRVIGNIWDPSKETTYGRGNLSFTSINLPRLGILAKKDIAKFYEMLDEKMELVADQLYERMLVQARKHVYNFPFLMASIAGLIRETRAARLHRLRDPSRLPLDRLHRSGRDTGRAYGKHHGESEEIQKLGLEIIGIC